MRAWTHIHEHARAHTHITSKTLVSLNTPIAITAHSLLYTFLGKNGNFMLISYFAHLDLCVKITFFMETITKNYHFNDEIVEIFKIMKLSQLDGMLPSFSCLMSEWPKYPCWPFLTELTRNQIKSKFYPNAKLHLFKLKLIFLTNVQNFDQV